MPTIDKRKVEDVDAEAELRKLSPEQQQKVFQYIATLVQQEQKKA